MPWRLLTYASAAFGALVGLLFGWWWLCRSTRDTPLDPYAPWENP